MNNIKNNFYRSIKKPSQNSSIQDKSQFNTRKTLNEKINLSIKQSSSKKEIFLRCVDLFQANASNNLFSNFNSERQVEELLKRIFELTDDEIGLLKEYCIHKSKSSLNFFYTRSVYELLNDLNYNNIDFHNVFNLLSWFYSKNTLAFSKVNFVDLDLTRLKFKNFNLAGAIFTNINFCNVDLSNSNLKNTQFYGCDLKWVKLFKTNLNGIKLVNCNWIHLKDGDMSCFKNATVISDYSTTYQSSRVSFDLRDFNYANFENADFSGINFRGEFGIFSNFSHAKFNDADCFCAEFFGASLSNARFYKAKLKNASFNFARLHSANLEEADLTEANLTGANLTYANLKGANLSGAVLNKAIINGTCLNSVNFSGSALLGLNLSGARLINVNLNNVLLDYYTNFKNTYFENTTLSLKFDKNHPGNFNSYDERFGHNKIYYLFDTIETIDNKYANVKLNAMESYISNFISLDYNLQNEILTYYGDDTWEAFFNNRIYIQSSIILNFILSKFMIQKIQNSRFFQQQSRINEICISFLVHTVENLVEDLSSYSAKNKNSYSLNLNNLSQSIYFLKKNKNQKLIDKVLELEKKYFNSLPNSLRAEIQNDSRIYPNLESISTQKNSPFNNHLLFMPEDQKSCMLLSYKYYEKFILNFGNEPQINEFCYYKKNNFFYYKTVSQDDYNLKEVFSKVEVFQILYKISLVIENCSKLFTKILFHDETKLSCFIDAIQSNRVQQRLINDEDQISLSNSFERLYQPESLGNILNLKIKDEFCHFILDCFEFKDITDSEQAEIFALLSALFCRLSSTYFLGAGLESPNALRYFAIALLNKTQELNRDFLSYQIPRWKADLSADFCTGGISSHMNANLRHSQYFNCIIPPILFGD